MPAIPYMPLYVADYLADAGHLTTTEHGAYLLLIMGYWQRGGPYRASDERTLNGRLANVARMSIGEWAKISRVIAEFFQVTQDDHMEWYHKRIEAELAKFRAKSLQAKEAGIASAQRRLSGRSTGVAIPLQRTFNHTDTDTDTRKSKSLAREARKKATKFQQMPEGFAEYPKTKFHWQQSRIDREAEKFANYWTSNGKCMVDWMATWRNWCLNAEERQSPKRAGNGYYGDDFVPMPLTDGDGNPIGKARVDI